MSNSYKIKIGLGNKNGLTKHVIIQEQKSKIEKSVAKGQNIQNPKISIKQMPQINVGGLSTLLVNKRSQNIIGSLLTVKSINYNQINTNCQQRLKNLLQQEQMLGMLRQQNQQQKEIQNFVKQIKCSKGDARKYIEKYQKNGIKVYKQHQLKIQKFMKSQNCSRENAISFLQSANYDIPMFD